MLKIKDNVDLKELEKYGFEYNKQENNYCKTIIALCWERDIVVFIDNPNFKNKEIKGYSNIVQDIVGEEWLEAHLYDLIKDGLVEKVDE